jgi:hypothetical protein
LIKVQNFWERFPIRSGMTKKFQSSSKSIGIKHEIVPKAKEVKK